MRRKIVQTVLPIALLVAMLISGVSGIGMKVHAADAAKTVYGTTKGTYIYEDEIQYIEMGNIFKDTWNDNGTSVAPSLSGYVFGGWCTKNEDGSYYMLSAAEAKELQRKTNSGDIYAKFVPAYVLSMKAQVDTDTANQTEGRKVGSIRLISSVDSSDYQKFGFEILLNNRNRLLAYNEETGKNDKPLETTRAYNFLKTSLADEKIYESNQIFGRKSTFFTVWRLDNIGVANDAKIINVTPYWITRDGTKVLGVNKYVHVEDGYNSNMYISVPINVYGEELVAAGGLTVTCPEGLELITDNGVEYGNVFPGGEMSYNYNPETCTIKFVGNTEMISKNVEASGIYVNLRFKKSGTASGNIGTGSFWNFYVENEVFCNWNEELVSVDALSIQY